MADIFNANDTDEGTVLDFCQYAREQNPRFDGKTFLRRAFAARIIVAEATPGRLARTIERW